MAKVESHLRVDISGGTLDLWPLFNFVNGAKTINAAVSLKAQTYFDLSSKPEVEIYVTNLNYKKSFKDLNAFLESQDHELDILKPVFEYYRPKFKNNMGFKLTTESESPVGGGLGGSSTLLVSIIRSIDAVFEIQREESEIVDLACNLESRILHTPAGTQDYFQAVKPGLSLISFDYQKRTRTFFKSQWLDQQKKDFKLIYSGHPHHSGLNNWRIFQKCVDKDLETLNILNDLKQISEDVYEDLTSGSGSKMADLLQAELNLRRRLATGYVNESLERVINFLTELGVGHFKICGAGGGGCMWALVPKDLSSELKKVETLHQEIKLIPCELIL